MLNQYEISMFVEREKIEIKYLRKYQWLYITIGTFFIDLEKVEKTSLKMYNYFYKNANATLLQI